MKFSRHSLDLLNTCHPDLVRLMMAAIEDSPLDFSVLEGHRTIEQERANIAAGTSRLKNPMSCYHCRTPSEAVDIAPCPIDWQDTAAFQRLAEHVLATAARLGLRITWGGNWPTLRDMPHYQLEDT